jgi:CBS domain-containing protein
MSVGQVCSRILATVSETETIRTAAERMGELEVGTLVVVSRGHPRHPVGIVTDRDLAIRCLTGLVSEETPVSRVMTAPVKTVDESTSLDAALDIMARIGTRRLVVTGSGNQLVGLLSLDDVLEVLVGQMTAVGNLLQQQQPRIPV